MHKDDYQATLIVMFGLAAANLTGFVRQAAVAHQLGAGRAADVYLIAFAVPEFIFIALPIVLSPAFIPLFADCRLRAGDASAWRFALRVTGALVAALLVLTALAGLGFAGDYRAWLSSLVVGHGGQPLFLRHGAHPGRSRPPGGRKRAIPLPPSPRGGGAGL